MGFSPWQVYRLPQIIRPDMHGQIIRQLQPAQAFLMGDVQAGLQSVFILETGQIEMHHPRQLTGPETQR